MTRTASPWAFAILLSAIFITPSSGKSLSKELSTDELLRLAPKLSLDDPGIRTLHVAGSFRPRLLKFDVAWVKGEHISLLLSDLQDGTPYVFAVDDRVMVYDSVRSRVIFGKPHSVSLDVRNSLKAGLTCACGVNHEEANLVQINVRSFFDGLKDLASKRLSDTCYTLEGHSQLGGKVTARIDTTRHPCYTRLEVKAKNDKDPVFILDTIVVNEDAPSDYWRFPTEANLKSAVTVVDTSQWKPDDAIPSFSSVFRAALREPGNRAEWEAQVGPVDWAKAKADDEPRSKALAKIVKELRDASSPSTQNAVETTTKR